MGKKHKKKGSHVSESKEQNDDLTKPIFIPAEFFDRALAYIIDCVILLIPIGWVTMKVWLKDPIDLMENPETINTIGSSPFWLNMVTYGIFAIYFILLAWLNKGQTLGQIIMRLKTVSEEVVVSQKPIIEIPSLSLKQAVLYGIGKAPPLIILFDLLFGWLISKKEKQIQNPMRAFQIWGETIVIKLEKKIKKQYEVMKSLN